MQVVDLTIKRVQPVENSINYLQFIYFGLNSGKGILSIFVEMFEYVDSHILDQFDCCNLPDEWKPSARMVLNHLENDDSQYLNFARSAFKQLNQDLPKKYSHLIK
ncbi:Hypothetical protein CINCED_3A008719, partial [Cinara cedri]